MTAEMSRLVHNGPVESPSKAETQSKCPGRIQLIQNQNPEHRLWTWRWDLMQQDEQSKWEGRSLSGAIPSMGENAKVAPKAAKGLPRPSTWVLFKKKPNSVLSTASRYVSAWFSDLSQAGMHTWQLVLAARHWEAPNRQRVSERSSECTGVNWSLSSIFFVPFLLSYPLSISYLPFLTSRRFPGIKYRLKTVSVSPWLRCNGYSPQALHQVASRFWVNSWLTKPNPSTS